MDNQNKYYTPTIEEFYLYRHIRLDKQEPFYIGIGKMRSKYSNTLESKYERAYSTKRSLFWKKITNKAKYKVEILLESDNEDFIKNKEIEFIKLYGRKDLKLGTLCNLTDGGEGCFNRINSLERNKKISEALKLRVRTKETYDKVRKSKYKQIVRSDGKEYNSLTEASKELNISIAAISKVLKNDKYSTRGYKWKYKSL